MQDLAQYPHALQFLLAHQQFLPAGAGTADVDGRVDALLGDLALEVQFLVAGALELLVDDFVHLRARVDQRSGDDGEAAAFLDVARGAEEALGALQRMRVDTAGQYLAGGGNDGVVGPGEPRDRIQQYHHVALVLHQALGLLDHHFRHLHVPGGRFVEGAGNHLAAHGALHLGDFLGPLVDEQHDEHHFRVVVGDGLGDVLQHQGLARFRRRDDQAALAPADGRDQVDDAGGDVLGAAVAAFEVQPLVRKQGRQVFEQQLVLLVVRLAEVDLVDLQHGEIALAVLGRADLAGQAVAGSQVEAADLAGRDVDVVGARQVGTVGGTEEAEPVLQDLQGALAKDVFPRLGELAHHGRDDFLFAGTGQVFETVLASQINKLDHRLAFQVFQVRWHGNCLLLLVTFGAKLRGMPFQSAHLSVLSPGSTARA